MVRTMVIGENVRKTRIRFRNFEDYETFSKSIDGGYNADDSISTGDI